MRDCMFISSEQNQIFHLPIIRQPDFIYVETENKTFALNSAPEEFRLQDVTVFCQEQKNGAHDFTSGGAIVSSIRNLKMVHDHSPKNSYYGRCFRTKLW